MQNGTDLGEQTDSDYVFDAGIPYSDDSNSDHPTPADSDNSENAITTEQATDESEMPQALSTATP